MSKTEKYLWVLVLECVLMCVIFVYQFSPNTADNNSANWQFTDIIVPVEDFHLTNQNSQSQK